MRLTMSLLLAWIVVVLLATGCQEELDASSGPASADVVADEVAAGAEVNSVPVSMAEFEIKMDGSLPAGPTKFIVSNVGQLAHNLQIKGKGVDRLLADEPIGPGDKAEMVVNLKPGSYVAFCPMFNHRDKGMEFEFEVTAQKKKQ